MVLETASKVRITFAWDALRELFTMRGSLWRWKCYADIVVQPKVLSALLCLSLVSSISLVQRLFMPVNANLPLQTVMTHYLEIIEIKLVLDQPHLSPLSPA